MVNPNKISPFKTKVNNPNVIIINGTEMILRSGLTTVLAIAKTTAAKKYDSSPPVIFMAGVALAIKYKINVYTTMSPPILFIYLV